MTHRALLAFALAASLLGCSVEKMPPTAVLLRGKPAALGKVAVLPSECGTELCAGLDALVLAELSFRGYQVVDLHELVARERSRREVTVKQSRRRAGVERESEERRVEVRGTTLSEVDVLTLRDELGAMGVDSLVRVRSARVPGRPARVAAVVRVTHVGDASLVWSALCEAEVSLFDSHAKSSERTVRCALRKAFQ